MQNSYIIDAFLSGLAGVMFIYVYISIKLRLKALNRVMSANDMAAALGQLMGRSVTFAAPFIILFLFCLWRAYHLMLLTQTWGYGGMGLLIAVAVIGVPAIWLVAMLTCIYHSGFARITDVPAPTKAVQPNLRGGFND